MKKINVLILTLAATFFISCSKPTMEELANERLQKLITEKLSSSELRSYMVLNQRVAYSGDSICIIHFNLQGTNPYGFSVSVPMEYILLWTIRTKETRLSEGCYTIDSVRKPVLESTKESYGKYMPSDEKEIEEKLRLASQVRTHFFGHYVKDE